LATSSTTGFTVVWDLKSKREVLTLSYPGAGVGGMGSMGNLGQMGASRRGITAIAWNPDVVRILENNALHYSLRTADTGVNS